MPEPEQKFGVPGTMTDEAYGHYFLDRERHERAMSACARHPRAAAVHSEMAERYEALALVFGAKRPDDPPLYS